MWTRNGQTLVNLAHAASLGVEVIPGAVIGHATVLIVARIGIENRVVRDFGAATSGEELDKLKREAAKELEKLERQLLEHTRQKAPAKSRAAQV
jgi:hypothetical protein